MRLTTDDDRRQPRRVTAALAVLALLSACSGDAPTRPPGRELAPAPTQPRFVEGAPAGWTPILARPDLYELGLEQGIPRAGTGSLSVRSRMSFPDPSAFVGVVQSLNASSYSGKRVRLSGWLRVSNVSGGAGLWMRVDGATRTLASDNMLGSGRPVRFTTEWIQYEVVLDIPTDAVLIAFGVLLVGPGIVSCDDLQLQVVDSSIPVTVMGRPGPPELDSATTVNMARDLRATPVNMNFDGVSALPSDWLASAARPFATDAPGSGFDDLSELGNIVGSARVVAFGEATHGTREFFRMKHRAFEYLVERHGFTHFAIEATMPESRAVDRYVTTGIGDPARLLANLYFWTWNTREVLDLIEWMRAYNVRIGAPRLRFFGFDMQSPQQAIDSAAAMLRRLDPAEGDRAASVYRCLDAGRVPGSTTFDAARYATNTSLTQQRTCRDSLQVLSTAIRAGRAGWSGRMSSEELDWLEQYALLVQQWHALAVAGNTAVVARDSAMAYNVRWIMARDPAARVFAWAHNGHVSRRTPAMGSYLAAAVGDSYRTIAFTFGQGMFNARTAGIDSRRGLTAHTISGIPDGTFEQALQATQQPRLILDVRRVTSGGPSTAPFRDEPVQMRSIGALYDPAQRDGAGYYERARLPGHYDGIIWFSTTTPSTLLPF